jgi:hypothetical protein
MADQPPCRSLRRHRETTIPTQPQLALWWPAEPDHLDGRVRLLDVFTAPATGKATALLGIRDGRAGVFGHHHGAPQKTRASTEGTNANQLVDILAGVAL